MDYAAYCNPVKAMCEVHAFALFPPESDFSKVCSCSECLVKIMKLKDFENYARLKSKQVTYCSVLGSDATDRSSDVANCSQWSRHMLDLLHNNLKAVDKVVTYGYLFNFFLTDFLILLYFLFQKLGFKPTLEKSTKLRDSYRKMLYSMLDSGLFPEFADDDNEDSALFPYDKDRIGDSDKILLNIKNGLFVFRYSNSKDVASNLLEKISKLEKKHKAIKFSALKEKKKLERQIKLLNKLPVDRLHHEFEEEMSKACFIHKNRLRLDEATKEIQIVCMEIVVQRSIFWQQYQSRPLTRACEHHGPGHGSSGLEGVLEFLLDKVTSFKKRWEEEYAQFSTLGQSCIERKIRSGNILRRCNSEQRDASKERCRGNTEKKKKKRERSSSKKTSEKEMQCKIKRSK